MNAVNKKNKKGFSKIEEALDSRFFRRFMSVAYGLGASIVIIGALFKITHIPGANEALFVGMITEAIIFALSALQKPHVEPDWSKVHPEFLEDYHNIQAEGIEVPVSSRKSYGQTNRLDEMLQEANIDSELITRLGSGLRNLSDTAARMNDMTKVSVANDEYVNNLKNATLSASSLSKSYGKASEAIERELTVSNEFAQNVRGASQAASELKKVYVETSTSLREDIQASQNLSQNIRSASQSASQLAENYHKSSESILKNIEQIQQSTEKNTQFNEQLKKLSHSLSSLNALYEMQLKTSEQQTNASAKLQSTLIKFLEDIDRSAQQTNQYQNQMDSLTKKMASLNNIYGNMLTAMNVK
jgi:gliding motility-associated protein GldL